MAVVSTNDLKRGMSLDLPDGPRQQARDAAMAASFGLSADIDWLYGHDSSASLSDITVAVD